MIVYVSEGGSKSCKGGDDKGKDSEDVKDSVMPDGVNRDCCVV